MFICPIVNKVSKPGEGMHKVVVATRERTYTKWVRNEETKVWEEVEAGHGWEVVKELGVSEEGLNLWQSWSDEERAAFLKYLG